MAGIMESHGYRLKPSAANGARYRHYEKEFAGGYVVKSFTFTTDHGGWTCEPSCSEFVLNSESGFVPTEGWNPHAQEFVGCDKGRWQASHPVVLTKEDCLLIAVKLAELSGELRGVV